MKILILTWLCAAAMLAGEGAKATDALPKNEPLETRGKAIVQQAFALLSSNLGQALAAGGVSNALAYCSEKALPLTQLAADTNHVRLRRVSHKPRNPANQANPTELMLLKQFQSQATQGKAAVPVLITNADQSVTFFSPITLNNPLCLNCHGEPGKNITSANAALIRRIYPKDRATGFKMGDLRGMWRVDFEPAALTR
ncbi:MAG TPA: DUF3365 domain-containing protein [Clostridia bacterium]|nr:DUF3365 domain-containing protein [Clostridia bacterium]